MDFGTNTYTNTVASSISAINFTQENTLLEIIKEICSESDTQLSSKLKGKVGRIIADCDLKHNTSLQRVSSADQSTATVLGFMHQAAADLTYDEQAELNQAIISIIDKKLPGSIAELERLKKSSESCVNLRSAQANEQKERDNKLNTLQEQETEQMELMMQWLNHRIQGESSFNSNSCELLALKTKIYNMKSKILHLQILQNIFTETNQSIKAYSEIHKDLKENIKETEKRIKHYRQIIDSDLA